MRIIPVIDVMGGVVVRAVGGRRDEYRPIVSQLTDSTDPVAVAHALLAMTEAEELYVADLDGITQTGRLSEVVKRLILALPVPAWVDVGLNRVADAESLPQLRHLRPVVASETLSHEIGLLPHSFRHPQRRATFSIDLRDGVPSKGWIPKFRAEPPGVLPLAKRAYSAGFKTLILLDIRRVGTGSGPGTEATCAEIRREIPEVELIAGGGVRDWADVRRLEDAGADGVLVASALHDGRLARKPGEPTA